MNFTSKMNKPSHFRNQSPYQRPHSEAAIGRTYNSVQNEQMGSAIRFSGGNRASIHQGVGTMPTNSMFNNPRTPAGQISSHFMNSEFSPQNYLYFQEVPGSVPFYPEVHSLTPRSLQEFNSPTLEGDVYHYQFEDKSINNEIDWQDVNNDPKSVPCTSVPKKSSQQVRFDLTSNNKPKNSTNIAGKKPIIKEDINVLNTTKRQQDIPKSLRVLSGSIDKIIKWEKLRESHDILSEVVATLVAVRPAGVRSGKMLLLRDQASPALQCLFYEIDRPLPPLERGQMVRCVGKMISKNKMHAFSVRVANVIEMSALHRLSFASQRVVTALDLATPEP